MTELHATPCPQCSEPFTIGVYASRLARRFCSSECIVRFLDSPGRVSYTQLPLPLIT